MPLCRARVSIPRWTELNCLSFVLCIVLQVGLSRLLKNFKVIALGLDIVYRFCKKNI